MKQKVNLFRINGECTLFLDGSGQEVRDKAIKIAKQGLEFKEPSIRLIAENIPQDVHIPSPDEILADVQDCIQYWYNEEDKQLLKTLERIKEGMKMLREEYR